MNAMNTSTGGPVVVPKLIDVNIVAKSNVTNDHCENLGKIQSLILDLETGKIAYAILEFGGFPNRAKLFAVPWELLTFSHHDKRLILNVPRDIMVKSPGDDNLERILESVDFTWLGEIYGYFSNKVVFEKKQLDERNAEVLKAQQKREDMRSVQPPLAESQT